MIYHISEGEVSAQSSTALLYTNANKPIAFASSIRITHSHCHDGACNEASSSWPKKLTLDTKYTMLDEFTIPNNQINDYKR